MKSAVVALSLLLAAALAPVSSPAPAVAADDAVSDGPLLSTSTYPPTFFGLDGSRRSLALGSGELGIRADFAPDGAGLLFERSGFSTGSSDDMAVLRSDGSIRSLGAIPDGWSPIFSSWGGNGAYASVVLSEDDSEGDVDDPKELWRFRAGAVPVRVRELPGVASPTGYAADARSDRFFFGKVGSVYSIDMSSASGAETFVAGEGCTEPIGCVEPVVELDDYDPVHGRLLATISDPEPGGAEGDDPTEDWLGLGWVSVATGQSQRWWRFPQEQDGSTVGWGGLVSPAGDLVATESRDDATRTIVRSAVGAGILRTIPASVAAWQPCPGGDCPVFVAPVTAPQSPRSVAAGSGARGRPVTAKASWTAPAADGGRPVLGYQVDAARLRSGRIVKHTVKTAPATARSLSVRLPAGRYRFRVRAVNEVGSGAWSAYSGTVAAR